MVVHRVRRNADIGMGHGKSMIDFRANHSLGSGLRAKSGLVSIDGLAVMPGVGPSWQVSAVNFLTSVSK